jgi:hypothetical protein
MYVIVLLPVATPVTTPVVPPIVALAGTELLHVPPVAVVLRFTVLPTHTLVPPVMAGIAAFTVTCFTVIQLPGAL